MEELRFRLAGEIGFGIITKYHALQEIFDTQNSQNSIGMLEEHIDEGMSKARAIMTNILISIGQAPNSSFGSVDILKQLAKARVRFDHVLQWQGTVTLFVKIERILSSYLIIQFEKSIDNAYRLRDGVPGPEEPGHIVDNI